MATSSFKTWRCPSRIRLLGGSRLSDHLGSARSLKAQWSLYYQPKGCSIYKGENPSNLPYPYYPWMYGIFTLHRWLITVNVGKYTMGHGWYGIHLHQVWSPPPKDGRFNDPCPTSVVSEASHYQWVVPRNCQPCPLRRFKWKRVVPEMDGFTGKSCWIYWWNWRIFSRYCVFMVK